MPEMDKFISDFMKKYPQGVYQQGLNQDDTDKPYDLLNKISFSSISEEEFKSSLEELRYKLNQYTGQPQALKDFYAKYWGLCPKDILSYHNRNRKIVDEILKKTDDFWEKVKQIEKERQGLADLPARIEELKLNNKLLSSYQKIENKIQITSDDVKDGYLNFSGKALTGIGIDRILVTAGSRRELAQLGKSYPQKGKNIVEWQLSMNYKYNPSGEPVF